MKYKTKYRILAIIACLVVMTIFLAISVAIDFHPREKPFLGYLSAGILLSIFSYLWKKLSAKGEHKDKKKGNNNQNTSL